jgi:hypothetical protein
VAIEAVDRLKRDAEGLLDAGRSVAREYGGAGDAFRRLVLSDIALARVALVRGLVFLLLAMLMIGTAYALATVLMVYGLHAAGVPWWGALLAPIGVSAIVALFAGLAARRALGLAGMDATRRQLAAWFPPGEAASTGPPKGQADPGPSDPDDGTRAAATESP